MFAVTHCPCLNGARAHSSSPQPRFGTKLISLPDKLAKLAKLFFTWDKTGLLESRTSPPEVLFQTVPSTSPSNWVLRPLANSPRTSTE